MRIPRRLFLLALLAALHPLRAGAADDLLPGVRRILFLGDSITYSGQYVDLFEAFLFTQAAERKFEVIDCGLPSETVSGLSEEGHADGKFPRPSVHERLDRVLVKTKPDLVFACYGTNDGIYLPLSEERFERFREGVLKLREKVAAAGAQIIHLTPPVFDARPIQTRVAAADKVDAAHPFEAYDEVLSRYSAWLLEQRAHGWRVIDVHGAMTAALAERRRHDPAFTFARDGVHPDDAGHRVIAHTLLTDLAPSRDAAIRELLDAKAAAPGARQIPLELIHKRGRLLTDAWLTATGHQRPGMTTGLPLEEARAKAAELEQKIRGSVAAP